MKALILAAGFGTRLSPYTNDIPKPLFTLESRPILAHTIEKLMAAGCKEIFINTHHLHGQIASFIKTGNYPVRIKTLHEPTILDTGGAIANARPFLKESPFFVINSDIICDVDLKTVYQAHQDSNCLATLVLHDFKKFNKVKVDDQGFITDFNTPSTGFAFTGIQVLSPRIFNHFPDKKKFSSIAVYQTLCSQNQVKALVEKNIFWADIGNVKSYTTTSFLKLAARVFQIPDGKISHIRVDRLAGDGSDRQWFRAGYKNNRVIISDHGICMPGKERQRQLTSFLHIGNHLHSKGIPVPRILSHDTLSGIVLLEDLGDLHLETRVKQENNNAFTLKIYQEVIDLLIEFSTTGVKGFKKEWTCQTETYSKEMILEKECRYFIEAFVQGYQKKDIAFSSFLAEFEYIADHALEHGMTGLMHRDLQSRNIMIKNNTPFFIDFHTARLGPLQYDLASLLLDPYVALSYEIQTALMQYTLAKLNLNKQGEQDFLVSYQFCCLTRNLQFLGAYSFLSQIKNKKEFEQYIPGAVTSLQKTITDLNDENIMKLSKLVQAM